MSFIIWPEVLIAVILVAILARVCTSARQFVSEESAHAAALERKRGTERRSAHQSVLVLGSEDGESGCQVISVSRRTIRIHSSRLLPSGSQLQVERGGDCFVCGIRKLAPAADGFNVELEVLASNCEHKSLAGRLWARTRQAVGRGSEAAS
jgi:hypothetical protein